MPKMSKREEKRDREYFETVCNYFKMKCDKCGKLVAEFHNPVGKKIVCDECFWKKMDEYLARHGKKEISPGDVKRAFADEKHSATMF